MFWVLFSNDFRADWLIILSWKWREHNLFVIEALRPCRVKKQIFLSLHIIFWDFSKCPGIRLKKTVQLKKTSVWMLSDIRLADLRTPTLTIALNLKKAQPCWCTLISGTKISNFDKTPENWHPKPPKGHWAYYHNTTSFLIDRLILFFLSFFFSSDKLPK